MRTKSIFFVIVISIYSISILSCSEKSKVPTSGFLDFLIYENGQCYAEGWAGDKEDGAPVEKVMVFIDDKWIGDAKLGFERPGVAREMINPNWIKSGWELSVSMPLDKGTHRAHAISVNKRGDKFRLHHEMEFEVK